MELKKQTPSLRFALTFAGAMVISVTSFVVLLRAPEVRPLIEGDEVRPLIEGDKAAVPAIIYLSFIMSWAIGYSSAFRFPNKKRIILLGVLIGTLLLTYAMAQPPELFASDDRNSPMVGLLALTLGAFVGASLQLGLVVMGFAAAKQLIKIVVIRNA